MIRFNHEIDGKTADIFHAGTEESIMLRMKPLIHLLLEARREVSGKEGKFRICFEWMSPADLKEEALATKKAKREAAEE